VESLVDRSGFGSANARDAMALRYSLGRIPRIKTRLAGVPDQIVAHAAEVMARFGQKAAARAEPRELREMEPGYLAAADDARVSAVIRELSQLDIGHLTPVQALVILNEWQGRLGGAV